MTRVAARRGFLTQASALVALFAAPALSIAAPRAAALRYPPVPPAYRQVASEFGLPATILFGVAIQESVMRWGATALPWPWTLNVRANPRRFSSYADALADLRQVLAQGVRNVDCGAMQVNWGYHADKLRTPALALDPWHNLRVAAGLLRQCRHDADGWFEAVGAYHSPANAERAERYARSVFRHIARIHDA